MVLDAILANEDLQGIGFNDDNVKVNYDGDQRPSDKMFMSLLWGQKTVDPRIKRGPTDLTIWVHMYKGFSTDYTRIDDVIEVLDDVLTNIIDTAGADGRTVSQIEEGNKSRDSRDSGYETLCRSASYKVFSRKTEGA